MFLDIEKRIGRNLHCVETLHDTCYHFGINTEHVVIRYENLSTSTQISVAETAVNNLAVLSF